MSAHGRRSLSSFLFFAWSSWGFVLEVNLVVHIHFEIVSLIVNCVLGWVVEQNFIRLPLCWSTKCSASNLRREPRVWSRINFNLNLIDLSIGVYNLFLDWGVRFSECVLDQRVHFVGLTVFRSFINQIYWALVWCTAVWETFRPVISVLKVIPITKLCSKCECFRIGSDKFTVFGYCTITFWVNIDTKLSWSQLNLFFDLWNLLQFQSRIFRNPFITWNKQRAILWVWREGRDNEVTAIAADRKSPA